MVECSLDYFLNFPPVPFGSWQGDHCAVTAQKLLGQRYQNINVNYGNNNVRVGMFQVNLYF